MAKPIPEHELRAVVAVVSAHLEGISIQDIQKNLDVEMTRHLLKYRLQRLVADGRLVREGNRRWTRYYLPAGQAKDPVAPVSGTAGDLHLSRLAVQIRANVRRPAMARKHVAYQREFLDAYRPNETTYLSAEERARLRELGIRYSVEQPPGTFARQILQRLLIDLSWNSSRLEGNTYSLLDTKRLIAFGEVREGKSKLETQMILNHKNAIKFLVDAADMIGFDRKTILSLHTILARNLLDDESAWGNLRKIIVGIKESVYHPPEIPQLIEECFDLVLSTAASIKDPYEQAFFAMVHLPYLQPFEDVNKRVSRLAANIPLIKENLMPLSFTEVPADAYTEAMLGVYELNRIELLKEVFIWACEQSASRYAVVMRSAGVPDSTRQKHQDDLEKLVKAIVIEKLDRKSAFTRIADWARANVEAGERDKFREFAENEILAIHKYNFPSYKITQAQFDAWREVWDEPG